MTLSDILKLIVDVIIVHIQFVYHLIEGLYIFIRGREPVAVKDEIILITGTGHGIGKELALQYSALGGNIVCVDINDQTNQETVREIKARGGQASGYVCDISKREKVFELADKIKAEVGSVSILVNNAGIMPCKPLIAHEEAEIRKMYDINVLAHLWTMQAFSRDMVNKNRGHIVALSSMAGQMGFKNLVPYCGSKFAVRGLMEAFSEELRADGYDGIKFTTIYPYMVDTGLCHKPIIRFEKMMPLVKPEECAASIIKAQRTGITDATVPSYLMYIGLYTRLFPNACAQVTKDFFNTGVGSHE